MTSLVHAEFRLDDHGPSRRMVLNGLWASSALMLAGCGGGDGSPAAASAGTGTTAATDPGTTAGSPIVVVQASSAGPVAYAQGMGATSADGYVVQFPLSTDGVARQVFVDSANGSDGYNGLSPYAGFKPNGAGPFLQHGASGKGAADGAWGPKATVKSAEQQLPALSAAAGDAGVGHQLLLAEGGLYPDPAQAESGGNRAQVHYGASAAYPFVIQSYDPSDPWNGQKMGRASGSKRPRIRLSADKVWNFASINNNSGGRVGNFAVRGVAFLAPDGSRVAPDVYWSMENFDGDNVLLENIDFGCMSVIFQNNSGRRFSRNFIARKCLFDHNYSATGSVCPSLYISYWVDHVVEECVFNHCTWVDTADGRYAAPKDGGAFALRHDVYSSGASQGPLTHRRNLHIDPAATALSNRNNSVVYNNVVIDAPIALISAGGVAGATAAVLAEEQPNGNFFDHHHNLVMGSEFINGPRMTIVSQPGPGQSPIRVGNVQFEFVSTGGSPAGASNPVTIGASVAATAANLAAALNARTEPLVSRVGYSVATDESGNPYVKQTPKSFGTPLVFVESYNAAVALNDFGSRGWAYAAANGVAGSTMRDSLIINSGQIANTNNAPTPDALAVGPGRSIGQSYAQFARNRQYAWGMSAEGDAAPSGTSVTYSANSYSASSPYTNDQVYQALGYSGKEAFRAAVVARHEVPWAKTIQDKVGQLFGFDFTVPVVTPPTVAAPAPSVAAPRIGDVVTFPDAAVPAGFAKVSATTYIDNHPIPNTGVATNTLSLVTAFAGKRVSRMVVMAPTDGSPGVVTTVAEIPSPVALL